MAYTTIDKSSLHFNTKLYTGNGSTNAITGVGFQPDMCWWKMRSGIEEHALGDAVRGAGYIVKPNSTDAQASSASYFASFDSDGFTLGSDTKTNGNGSTYASWNWKANGAGSSNTDGSITSTVSVNTTAGFSIVTHTGTGSTATIGHGLGAVPKVIITKKRSAADNWFTYHHSIGNGKYLLLESTDAQATSSNVWNDTSPTSSVFTRGGPANDSGATYVQYCFAEKQGYSKFGSYTGNGNTDGSFVYTGFKPAFVMMKGYESGGSDNWNTCDNKRVGYNAANWRLYPNATAGENSTSLVDLLSNGFKLKVSSTDVNANAKGYIFMAFAEAPLVGSNNVPCTAR